MSIRLRALAYTVGFVGSALIAGMAIAQILSMIPGEYLPWVAITGLIAVGGTMVYSMTKTQLEYREKLQQMVDQK